MIIAHIASQPEIWSELVESADSGQQSERDDRLQSDLRIRRACRTSNASWRRFGTSVSTKTQRELVEAAVSGRENRRKAGDDARPSKRRRDNETPRRKCPTDCGADHGRRDSQRESRFAVEKSRRHDRARRSDFVKSKPTRRSIRFESSFAGTMGEWKTKVGDTVDIGRRWERF